MLARFNPFGTLGELVSWLREQPPEKEYNYTDNTNCVLAQYLKARGHKHVSVGPLSATLGDGQCMWFTMAWHDIAQEYGSNKLKSERHSFGAALTRAEALMDRVGPQYEPFTNEGTAGEALAWLMTVR